MTKQEFFNKYTNILKEFEKLQQKEVALGKYIDIFYECSSNFCDIYSSKWTKSDESKLVRILDDCATQPIYGIKQFLRWFQLKEKK